MHILHSYKQRAAQYCKNSHHGRICLMVYTSPLHKRYRWPELCLLLHLYCVIGCVVKSSDTPVRNSDAIQKAFHLCTTVHL